VKLTAFKCGTSKCLRRCLKSVKYDTEKPLKSPKYNIVTPCENAECEIKATSTP
jgi:hypothetical protein